MLWLVGGIAVLCFAGLCVAGVAGYRLLATHLAEQRAARLADQAVADARIFHERQIAEQRLALDERDVAVRERTIAVQEQRAKTAMPVSIPPDLVRRIQSWQTPEAQEAERKVILDLFYDFEHEPDPWLEVRHHLPPEPQDERSTDGSEMFVA